MPVKPEFAQLDTGEVQRCIYIPSPIRTFILYVPDDSEHYRWLAAIEASRLQSRASKAGWLVKQGERVKVRAAAPRPAWMLPGGVLNAAAPLAAAACDGPERQNWKRRWFVLLDRQLIYYETEEVERLP